MKLKCKLVFEWDFDASADIEDLVKWNDFTIAEAKEAYIERIEEDIVGPIKTRADNSIPEDYTANFEWHWSKDGKI